MADSTFGYYLPGDNLPTLTLTRPIGQVSVLYPAPMYSLRYRDKTSLNNTEVVVRPSLKPLKVNVGPAGYTATSRIQSDNTKKEHAPTTDLVQKVLKSPLLMQKLTDRVYELMREELRLAHERRIHYGEHF
ncbi:hypothetical protein BST81_13090 [Leptolyngbya sp. 'hensonii']|uniref:hypothetical protein n=1 Tax=Leptolyngbya sp. 'hensonii' TaxID=1922337 RepID=UPI00095AECC1|nr:hypothetical protein [Leptolyngbya sp. 'hensonii']OLP17980.1 hypothetical protein BST81_13090 [Leptolyngbya sp. 'hensonii']